MWKRLTLICTLGAAVGIFVVPLNPVNNLIFRLAFLGCVIGAWIGLTILLWNQSGIRIGILLLPVIVTIPFILPSDPIDTDELRRDYVQRMAGFEGTQYYWGGENRRGIDCSGLPRKAMRDALLNYGINHFNGHAFRSSLEQWWFDASARALGDGYRDYTRPIGIKGTIREMNVEKLVEGDLAVTNDGLHILAYMGHGSWIQADPGIGAVITLNGTSDENIWFRTPVTTHRWQLLSNRSGNRNSVSERRAP